MIPARLRARMLEAMQSTLCGDYCLTDNCKACNEARLEAIEVLVGKYVVTMLEAERPGVELLVSERLLPARVLDAFDKMLEPFRHED